MKTLLEDIIESNALDESSKHNEFIRYYRQNTQLRKQVRDYLVIHQYLNPEKCLDLAQLAYQAYPSKKIIYNICQCLLTLENYAEIENYWLSKLFAPANQPPILKYRLVEYELYLKQLQYEKAIQVLIKSINDYPNNFSIKLELAQLYDRMGDYKQSVICYTQLLINSPKQKFIYQKLLNFAADTLTSSFSLNELLLNHPLIKNVNHPTDILNLAKIYYLQHQYDNGLLTLNRLITKDHSLEVELLKHQLLNGKALKPNPELLLEAIEPNDYQYSKLIIEVATYFEYISFDHPDFIPILLKSYQVANSDSLAYQIASHLIHLCCRLKKPKDGLHYLRCMDDGSMPEGTFDYLYGILYQAFDHPNIEQTAEYFDNAINQQTPHQDAVLRLVNCYQKLEIYDKVLETIDRYRLTYYDRLEFERIYEDILNQMQYTKRCTIEKGG